MGRVKQPLDNDGPAATFAAMLRAQRTVAGTPPYRAMASHTGWAHTTLSLADNGDRLPTWPCTQAYLRACEVSDAAMRWWHDRWTEAVDGIALRKAVVAASRTPRHARESLREPDGLIHVANRGELLRLLVAPVR